MRVLEQEHNQAARRFGLVAWASAQSKDAKLEQFISALGGEIVENTRAALGAKVRSFGDFVRSLPRIHASKK